MDNNESSSSPSESGESDYKIILYSRSKYPKVFHDRIDTEFYNEEEFRRRFRFSKEGVHYLASILQQLDFHGYPLTTIQQILLCLRYYATGSIQIVIGDLPGINQSAAGNVIHKISKAIARKNKDFIKMPVGEEINKTEENVYNKSGIPRCIGCIDRTHIPIKSPGGDDTELYRSQRGYFSINTQAICDADGKFLDIVARWFRSLHNQTIFNFSQIKARFEQNEFSSMLLIGDSGHGCKPYLMTPYRNPRKASQERYNHAVSSTRSVWKRRFPVLAINSQLYLQNTLTIIVATAVLHIIAIILKEENAPVDEDLNLMIPPDVQNQIPNSLEAQANFDVRDEICRNLAQ